MCFKLPSPKFAHLLKVWVTVRAQTMEYGREGNDCQAYTVKWGKEGALWGSKLLFLPRFARNCLKTSSWAWLAHKNCLLCWIGGWDANSLRRWTFYSPGLGTLQCFLPHCAYTWWLSKLDICCARDHAVTHWDARACWEVALKPWAENMLRPWFTQRAVSLTL